jgi:hypothetical protein
MPLSDNCIYVTNPQWADFLRNQDIRQSANFWRKDRRHLALRDGANFYFKLKGSNFVAGRGKFAGMKMMSLKEAWETYGQGNGVGTFKELVRKAHDVLHIPRSNGQINCVELNDLEFLPPEQYYQVSPTLFPSNILAAKFFSDDQLENLNQRFAGKGSGISDQIPEQVANPEGLPEGATRKILINSYERNREARRKCIAHFGARCLVCGFNFEAKYGELGRGFIHVHHVVPLAAIRKEYVIRPTKDLKPVCPNCHAMLHAQNPALSIEALRRMIRG